MSDLPAPLVPADVDLRDFPFMPLDVLRLRDSDLACVEDAEVFRCAVLSWCVSWHQIPAASLPDDDVLLARLLGFGRDVKGWKRVRAAGGMRGWLVCDDGRLYHPVVGVKARDAWAAKLAQRARTEAARKAREEARQRQSQSLSQTATETATETVTETVTETATESVTETATETVTASKGQGQGQGQGYKYPPTPRKRGASVHGFPPGFEAFWAAYPRKVAKEAAAKAFARLRPDERLLGLMLAELRRQAASAAWQKDRGEFVPHAATWLNGKRWEDADAPSGFAAAADPFAGAL